MMQETFSYSIFGNSIYEYSMSLFIFMGGFLFVYLFKKIVLNRLRVMARTTETSIDDMLLMAISKVIPAVYVAILFLSLHILNLTARFERGLELSAIVLVTILVVRAMVSTLNLGMQIYLDKTSSASGSEKQLKGIGGLVNILIWTLTLVFLLDNLGVKISAVVAGLGIGGIAVALAAQAVLGDLFSYFVIFFDKPFEVGDFIIVGDKMGSVEVIGIKTTRIRALSGEQLVFSNTDLTNSRVHNYKKMERRRVVFKLGVIYQTTSQKLKAITHIVKQAIEAQEGALYERGHFSSYGDFSLNFEFVYHVTGADYKQYMDIQQEINFAIFDAFEKENIEFAYPSQTVFLNKDG